MKIKHMVLGLSLMTGVAFAQTSGTTTPPPGTQDQSGMHSGMGRHHRGDRHGDMKEHEEKLTKELNLTADQQTKVQGIMKDTGAQMRAIHQDTSLTEDQREVKLKALHESTHSKINAVLTPEQQTKFTAMRKNMHRDRKEKREEWREKHKHHKGDKDHDKDDKDHDKDNK